MKRAPLANEHFLNRLESGISTSIASESTPPDRACLRWLPFSEILSTAFSCGKSLSDLRPNHISLSLSPPSSSWFGVLFSPHALQLCYPCLVPRFRVLAVDISYTLRWAGQLITHPLVDEESTRWTDISYERKKEHRSARMRERRNRREAATCNVRRRERTPWCERGHIFQMEQAGADHEAQPLTAPIHESRVGLNEDDMSVVLASWSLPVGVAKTTAEEWDKGHRAN